MKATTLLTQTDLDAIGQKIHTLEKQSQVEVVCACATESGRYDRAESIFGLIVAVLALCFVYAINERLPGQVGDWSAAPLELGWLVAAVVIGFVIGSLVASYVHSIRRRFVSQKQMDREVNRSVRQVYALAKVGSTDGKTGLLIYVSCFERKIVILAGATVQALIGQEMIERLCATSAEFLKQGKPLQAFVDPIDGVAERLISALPAAAEQQNELANHLLIFHPRPI